MAIKKPAELIVEKEIDILYTKELFKGKGPEYVFSEGEVEVVNIDLHSLEKLLELNTKTLARK